MAPSHRDECRSYNLDYTRSIIAEWSLPFTITAVSVGAVVASTAGLYSMNIVRKRLLRRLAANGLHVQRIQRLATGHEQTVPLDAAEAQVGARFRKDNPPDQFTLRRQAVHAVRSGAGPAHAGPQVAVAIGPNAVGKSGRHIGEHLAAAQLPPLHDLENPDVSRSIGTVGVPGVGDVEPRLVRGKAQPVRLDQVVATTVASPLTGSSR